MANYGNPDKARHYLPLLDSARCNGRWQEVPELARKVGKHAPSRRCLVLTAQMECEIVRRVPSRPGTVVSGEDGPLKLVKELKATIEQEKNYLEDIYQAQTALAWLRWTKREWKAATAELPSTAPPPHTSSTEKASVLWDWTYVCIVKCAYIHASSEESISGPSNSTPLYESSLRNILMMSFTRKADSAEFSSWWEAFLVKCCDRCYDVFRKAVKSNTANASPGTALAAYRSWAEHREKRQRNGVTSIPQDDQVPSATPRSMWKAYYDLLSTVLQYGYTYPPKSSPLIGQESDPAGKGDQQSLGAELRRIEEVYEQFVLKENTFPEASVINHDVDDWTDQVMLNWSVLCNPHWQGEGFGAVEQIAASRHVLAILYRAATRTFHSTTILRHLFTVHAALAEFRLAIRALNTYVEIVTKGKSRVEKSGKPEPSLDSDDLMLQTISAGISMLCEFGKRDEAARAQELADYLETWLSRHDSVSSILIDGTRRVPQTEAHDSISKPVLALVHKSIAISRANWAHFTYESSTRGTLQATAVSHLRQALKCDHASEEDPSILYPLALVLAETRDIDDSIATVKQALASESRVFTEPVDRQVMLQDLKSRSTRKEPLIDCWHLLALLLSARHEFETAEVSCEAAIDQFEEIGRDSGSEGSHLSRLGHFEKQRIVEAKMTQISLSQINDGPEVAVNAAAELVELYTRLFDVSSIKRPPTAKSTEPPKTAATTIKSFRGSLLGRGRRERSSIRDSALVPSMRSRGASHEVRRPPTISVTEERDQAVSPTTTHSVRLSRQNSHKLQKRPSKKSVPRSRTVSPARSQATPSAVPTSPTTIRTVNGDTQGNLDHPRPVTATSHDTSEVGLAVSHDLRASVTAQFDSLSMSTLPSELNSDSPFNLDRDTEKRRDWQKSKPQIWIPSPRFSDVEQQRYGLALLNKTWLFIASLYRRANMFEDAQGAIDEAFKQAKLCEIAAASADSSAQNFEDEGWGGVRSVEEVWADVYAEMGHLSVAQSRPHEAMMKYEGALSHHPDHPAATIGLSNILLDIYAEKIPPQPTKPAFYDNVGERNAVDESSLPILSKIPQAASPSANAGTSPDAEAFPAFEPEEIAEPPTPPHQKHLSQSKTPEALDRLAARDRAYGLLSSLTKLGAGWDDGEAWFALARAYEESGQIEKAKEVLWWVVELEEKAPARRWSCLGRGYCLRP